MSNKEEYLVESENGGDAAEGQSEQAEFEIWKAHKEKNKQVEGKARGVEKNKNKKVKKQRKGLSEGMLNSILIVFMSAFFTLLCLAPVGYLMYKKVPKPVGVIDIQGLVTENQRDIVAAFSGGEYLSEEEKMASLRKAEEWTAKLNNAVEKVSNDCGCVLINKAAVLTDAKKGVMVDYTDKVRELAK